jgi:hypothetical protein
MVNVHIFDWSKVYQDTITFGGSKVKKKIGFSRFSKIFTLWKYFFLIQKMMALKRRLSMRNKYFTSVLYRFFADTQQIQLHAEHCGM